MISSTKPDNPRSYSFLAYDGSDYVALDFTGPGAIASLRAGKTLEVSCCYDGEDYTLVRLTLPQAKTMREFLDHFIKTEEQAIPMFKEKKELAQVKALNWRHMSLDLQQQYAALMQELEHKIKDGETSE